MRIVVRLGAETWEVEVADDLGSARVGDRRYPVQVTDLGAGRVEVEVAGERVVLEGWPAGSADPPAELVLNGERVPVAIERTGGTVARPPVPVPAPTGPPPPPTGPGPGGGAAIVPPMPGKVVELRVAEGDTVRRGQVLLVLEAMKMRNEVASPKDGVVRRLAVAVGANVRPPGAMLWVE